MTRNNVKILKVRLFSTSTSSVLKKINNFLADLSPKKLVIFTPNPEFLVEASKNSQFRDTLNTADINIPDGIGLVWAGKILGQRISERVSGADLVEKILLIANSLPPTVVKGKQLVENWKVGIAGARRGIREEAEDLIKRLQKKYPNVDFINLDNPTNSNQWLAGSRNLSLVLACHGMVKQENWISENKDKINAKVFLGVGGALDFLTGFAKRAPVWMRTLGLEWLWRGLQRPGHFRRIWRATAEFGWLVARELIQSTKYKVQS